MMLYDMKITTFITLLSSLILSLSCSMESGEIVNMDVDSDRAYVSLTEKEQSVQGYQLILTKGQTDSGFNLTSFGAVSITGFVADEALMMNSDSVLPCGEFSAQSGSSVSMRLIGDKEARNFSVESGTIFVVRNDDSTYDIKVSLVSSEYRFVFDFSGSVDVIQVCE